MYKYRFVISLEYIYFFILNIYCIMFSLYWYFSHYAIQSLILLFLVRSDTDLTPHNMSLIQIFVDTFLDVLAPYLAPGTGTVAQAVDSEAEQCEATIGVTSLPVVGVTTSQGSRPVRPVLLHHHLNIKKVRCEISSTILTSQPSRSSTTS